MNSTVKRQYYKAAVMDGPNLWRMLQMLGIEYINYSGLVHVLKNLVGLDLPLAQPPWSTIHPDHKKKRGRLYTEMKRAGIQLEAVENVGEADDLAVKRMLHHLAHQEEVLDIVLFSGDGDLIHELLWLAHRHFKESGRLFRIDVVGTCTCDGGEASPVSSSCLREIRKHPLAHFSDLMSFRTHLCNGVVA